MRDINSIIVSCENSRELVKSTNRIIAELGGNLGREFSAAIRKYMISDYDSASERLNGRSVAEILHMADVENPSAPQDIVSEGEEGGVRYKLYEAPDKPEGDN